MLQENLTVTIFNLKYMGHMQLSSSSRSVLGHHHHHQMCTDIMKGAPQVVQDIVNLTMISIMMSIESFVVHTEVTPLVMRKLGKGNVNVIIHAPQLIQMRGTLAPRHEITHLTPRGVINGMMIGDVPHPYMLPLVNIHMVVHHM